MQHDPHEHEERDRDEGVAFDHPVQAAEVRDPGAQPLDGASVREVGAGVAREQPAAERGGADGQDGGAGQRESDREAGHEREHHEQDEDDEKDELHGVRPNPAEPESKGGPGPGSGASWERGRPARNTPEAWAFRAPRPLAMTRLSPVVTGFAK